MKKNITVIAIILAVAGILGILSLFPENKTANNQSVKSEPALKTQQDTNNMSIAVSPAEKVEVFLFHRTQRCITCITIGKLSAKTVQENFGPEVSSGKVVFREVNIDEPQNKELAEKFQASGSSLFINAIREGSDDILEDTNVWRLTKDEESFKNYLTGKINGLLGKQ